MHGTLTMHQSYVHFCIVQELVSPLGLVINIAKCEVYSLNDLSMFPSEMRRSNVPHLEMLGSPIGDAIFCANFFVSEVYECLQITLPASGSPSCSTPPAYVWGIDHALKQSESF